jgi:hypothetical protein
VSISNKLPLRTTHGCNVRTSKAGHKSTANDHTPLEGFQGGLGGVVQYQASGRLYEFRDDD